MLSGKTALVSGSSSGIGRAIAERFGELGANVGITYHSNQAGADAAAETVRSAGGDAIIVEVDLKEFGECEKYVNNTRDAFGPIDILVNNAGTVNREPLAELEESEWKRVLSTNLGSYYRLSKLVIPNMAERGTGAVVNVSSIWGQNGTMHRTAYGATKGAIESMTRHHCKEFAPEGVRINSISPGPIRSEMNVPSERDDATFEEIKDAIPYGRFGRPEEVASVVAFLVGPEAEFVHGSNIVIDGGLTV